MAKIQSAAGKDKGHEEIGKIKDKYEKGKKKDEGNLKEKSSLAQWSDDFEKKKRISIKSGIFHKKLDFPQKVGFSTIFEMP